MFSLLPLLLVQSHSAATKSFPLTVESIMRGYELVGHAPRQLRWSPDGSELTFSWAKADGSVNPGFKDYVVKRDGTRMRPGDGSDWPEVPEASSTTPRPSKEAYLSGGDVFVRSPGSEGKRLTTGLGLEDSPRISRDGAFVAYLKGSSLYSLDVATGASKAVFERPSPAPAPPSTGPTPAEAALAKETAGLIKYFTGGASAAPSAGGGASGGLGGGQFGAGGRGRFQDGGTNTGLTMNPAADHAVFALNVPPAAPGRATEVPAYVTRDGFTGFLRSYPKVGEPEGSSKVVVVSVRTGAKVEIVPPRPGRVGRILWSPDGMHGAVWAQANDHKDAWLYGFDANSDKVSVLWTEHDDAWIGGPGRGLFGWLPDGSRLYFESENTGYANLMTCDPDGGNAKNLTPGPYEVSRVQMDSAHSRFVFVSSEGSPFKRHVDSIWFDGSFKKKLADYSADEDASFAISPDGEHIAVVRSTPTTPGELYIDNVKVTTTPSADWLAAGWMMPETVMVPGRDGTPVPARLYKPKRWRRGGPAVIFVHGAGYLQNVYDGWSHYYREYMFHNLLADRGYVVLDIDYRGSAGYGKAWRTAIYRHMGGKDLDDQVDGAKYLISTLGVAKDRIGIYGGSYGGFITLMAMFTTPDVFAAGAALRPVSDWSNYNHGYTSDILNLPQDDPEAYRISSPITFADGLKGALLICHGMVDTNVHFQDTVRLMERLIELHKKNWEVAPFPVEDHDFQHPESWMDEYSRILALFERTIGPNRERRR